MNEIQKRLAALEKHIIGRAIPTREQWREQWQTMDDISKVIYVVQAENMDTLSHDRYMTAIRGYLLDDGFIDIHAQTLIQAAQEMDTEA